MISNTEVFLDEYKKLESAVVKKYDLPTDGTAVSRLERLPEFKSIRSELAYCREVRNLLQHKPKVGNAYAVEPSDQMIDLLRTTINKITSPPCAMDIAISKSDVLFKSMDDYVRPTMVEMLRNKYTHIPILKDGIAIGAFSENTLLAYLVDEEIVGIEDSTRFSDLAQYIPLEKHVAESFRFVSQRMPVAEISLLFEDALSHQDRIGMVFVTHSGKSTEKMLGIITAWDVAGMG